MQLLQVSVLDCILDGDAALGVPTQHRREQVQRRRCHRRKGLRKGLSRHLGERLDELPTLLVRDLHELDRIRGAQETYDKVELVLRVVAREERSPHLHLGEDAADRPDVDGPGVVRPRAEDLRCPVPSGADVLGHGAHPVLVREADTRQAEVAYLEVTIAVHEEVPGLQVSVDDQGRVHILHAAKELIEEKLAVVVREDLR
mmetsp:Transcript_71437/g.159958  ORF Transcript_71437/g.159958 Transcript_71437/m.159958 type:complete len:201 (+) Transcript_71437:377-979(+)